MITIWTVSLVFAALGIAYLTYKGRRDDGWTILGSFMVGLFGIFLSGMFLGLLGLLLGYATGTHPEVHRVRDLQAIKTNSGTQGSFFLGSGYVEEVQSYVFYVQNSDGSYYMDSAPAGDTRIVEDSSETPHITTYVTTFDWPIYPDAINTDGYTYIITVPEGSVEPEINMELP